jgi:hypothetical protein
MSAAARCQPQAALVKSFANRGKHLEILTMHTYPIHASCNMASSDINLLEAVTGAIISAYTNRTLVSIAPENFPDFSARWNSYRQCLSHPMKNDLIKEWRKDLEHSLEAKYDNFWRAK